jgi:hypothetical protein
MNYLSERDRKRIAHAFNLQRYRFSLDLLELENTIVRALNHEFDMHLFNDLKLEFPSHREVIGSYIEGGLLAQVGCRGRDCVPCTHGWVRGFSEALAELMNQAPEKQFNLTLEELKERVAYWDLTHPKPIIVDSKQP